jgi:hypothetical protein
MRNSDNLKEMEKNRSDLTLVKSHVILLTLIILIAALHFAKLKLEHNSTVQMPIGSDIGSYESGRR